MTAWWLAFRYFANPKRLFNLSTSLSILGLVIGVASLVVSMAVFSGYQKTLEKTVQDAIGHVLVLKRGSASQSEMMHDLEPVTKGLVAKTPFIFAEAILAHQGKINGVLIEGVDESTVHQVLNLKDRMIAGSVKLARPEGSEGEPKVLIGKVIAEKFNLKIGDIFRIVIPLVSDFNSVAFKPKLGRFEVAGIVNFGRHDFDSRYVVMELSEAQKFAELGNRVTGFRLKIEDPYKAREISQDIANKFGTGYWARDWLEVNRNLFEATRLEKAVLFFILQILVIAAAFNVANTLFISVVQKYRDISVLKTLGAKDGMIRMIFTAQGLIIGVVGAVLGILLGLVFCEIVEWAQVRWNLIPAEVYKLDRIKLSVSPWDLTAIVFSSMLVCFVATLVPARRGSRITPVEGLRYE